MKRLIVILICIFIPAMVSAQSCDDCGQSEIVPIETTSQEFVNESGNIIYIVTEGGDVSGINIGTQTEPEKEAAKEEAEPIKPQVKYGAISGSWWTGIAICNPYDVTKTGMLKINNQYFNVSVTPGAPLTFNLTDWVGGDGQYTVSLWAEDLMLDVILRQSK